MYYVLDVTNGEPDVEQNTLTVTGVDGMKFWEERKWLESQEFDLSLAVLLNIDWYLQCTLYWFKIEMFNKTGQCSHASLLDRG